MKLFVCVVATVVIGLVGSMVAVGLLAFDDSKFWE